MAQLLDLASLSLNKVSVNLYDYTMMLTAPSGWGKTPFVAELFGEDALILAFENSAKGIDSSYVVNVDSYATLVYYMNQLKNPTMKEKFKVIVIDTLWMFDFICENAVLDQYGKDLMSDCLSYNKGYKVKDKKALDMINELKGMGYGICYICHPSKKQIKGAEGVEFTRFEPKVSERMAEILVPEIDIRLFGYFDENGERAIYTQGSQSFDARCRVGKLPPVLKCDADEFKKAFADGIKSKYKSKNLVKNLEERHTVKAENRNFDEVMQELLKLGEELAKQGKGEKANEILDKGLGTDSDGKQRTLKDVNASMVAALEAIIINLKAI